MVPKTTVEVADENTAKKILRLMDALEENDDVHDVYANSTSPTRPGNRRRLTQTRRTRGARLCAHGFEGVVRRSA